MVGRGERRMSVIGPRWTCPYCGTHYVYKSSAIVCYESVCFTQKGEEE